MATRWARFARGWSTALIAVFVAVLSHVAGGGAAPGLLSIVLALSFSGVACVALAGKTLSVLRLSLSVGFSQLAFHLLFTVGSSSAMLATTGSAHHGTVSLATDPTAMMAPDAMGPHTLLPATASMWAAHAVAAIVTIAVLRRGEAAFWSILDYARSRLSAVFVVCAAALPVSVDAAAVTRMILAENVVTTDLGVLLSTMRHRGPPVPGLAR